MEQNKSNFIFVNLEKWEFLIQTIPDPLKKLVVKTKVPDNLEYLVKNCSQIALR